jgi:hypothetical protein
VETIVKRAAGLDVHKAQVTACVRVPGGGRERAQEVAEFATTVRGLLALCDWLKAHQVTQVAMEARGVRKLDLACKVTYSVPTDDLTSCRADHAEKLRGSS